MSTSHRAFRILACCLLVGLGSCNRTSDPDTVNKKPQTVADIVGKAFVDAVRATVEKLESDLANDRQLRGDIADGAHDPGAVSYFPASDPAIHLEGRYSRTIVDDKTGWRLDRVKDHAPVDRDQWMKVQGWRLSAGPNWQTVMRFTTMRSDGWRPGYGRTDALTITLAHRDSFFPFSEAVYRDQFVFARVAQMLNSYGEAAFYNANRGHLVIVDNREAYRQHNKEMAALRSHDQFQPFNHERNPALYPEAVTVFPRATQRITYDAITRTVTDTSDGSTFQGLTYRSRDESSWEGKWFDARSGRTANVRANVSLGYKPGYGATVALEIASVTSIVVTNGRRVTTTASRAEMRPERLAMLLNYFGAVDRRPSAIGNFVIIDTRNYRGRR
jgi:hypothetical protein